MTDAELASSKSYNDAKGQVTDRNMLTLRGGFFVVQNVLPPTESKCGNPSDVFYSQQDTDLWVRIPAEFDPLTPFIKSLNK